jgi:hypothetical protein
VGELVADPGDRGGAGGLVSDGVAIAGGAGAVGVELPGPRDCHGADRAEAAGGGELAQVGVVGAGVVGVGVEVTQVGGQECGGVLHRVPGHRSPPQASVGVVEGGDDVVGVPGQSGGAVAGRRAGGEPAQHRLDTTGSGTAQQARFSTSERANSSALGS